jgi:phage terminase large subunit
VFLNHLKNDKTPWICDNEYYYDSKKKQRQKTDDEYADDMFDFMRSSPLMPSHIIIDPSAASLIATIRRKMNKNGLYAQIVGADNSVLDGIRTQSTALNEGNYLVHRRCRNVIDDYYAYMWDDKASAKGEDKPLKVNDHTKDAERYFAMWAFLGGRIDYEGGCKT